jgi:catecholate siderophore receptor
VDIYAPNPNDAVTGYAPTRTAALTKGWSDTLALYAFDSATVAARWQLSGGVRWERYSTNFRSVAASGTLTANERAADGLLTGKAGVLYRLTPAANLYFSFGATATPPGTSNFTLSAQANNQNNPNVRPQRSKNYELGGKWDLFNRRLSMNAAAFHTRNDNVIFTVDASATPPVFNQNDGQKVRGLTLGAAGTLTPRLNILASWGWLNAHAESQNALNNGRRLTLTPPRSGNLWTTFQMAGSLTVGGGLRYTDTVNVNAAGTIRSPGYTLADAVIDYAADKRFSLRLNVNNLTNARYIRGVNNNGNRYNPGSTRSFMLTTSVHF